MTSVAGAQTAAPAAPAWHEPARIAVVGNDYAFAGVPATVEAGATLLSFENHGQVRHEMSVTLLRPGVTLAQVVELHSPQAQRLYEKIIGILIARPGDSSGGQLFVDLQPGRTYLVVCTLKDAPDAHPHIDLGMVTSFTVR